MKHKIVFDKKENKQKEYFLVKKSDLYSKIHYINWTLKKLNKSKNISIIPYSGKKYNPDKFCWIILEV